MSKTILSRIRSIFSKYELMSSIKTFFSIFITLLIAEGPGSFDKIFNGDFSWETLTSLLGMGIRLTFSAIGVMWTGKTRTHREEIEK